ncbi:MAG: hypothetical protein AAB250_15910 [Bdellovibrionota bacterium]
MASIFAFVGAMLVGYVAIQKTMEMQISVVLNQVAIRMLPQLDFRYRNVRVSLWERAVRINGISIQSLGERESLRIERVSVSEVDWDTIFRLAQTGGMITLPRTVRVGFKGMHLTPRLLGAKPAALLKQLGYDDIELSMSSGFLFDRSAKIFGIDRMNVEIQEMGRLSFSVEVGDFPFPTDRDLIALSRDPKSEKPPVPEFADLTLRYGEIRYDDFSLVGRVDQMLKNEGMPGLAAVIESSTRLPASADGFVGQATAKLKKFIATPEQSIRLSTRPSEPLPFAAIGLEALLGPDKLAKRLDLRLDVN